MSIKYRIDIDSLRALAVLSVIAFHLGFLKMGYLGVDVFFVISGFLITQIIQADLNAKKFSFWTFYFRRIKRILPLVVVVCLTSLFLGFMFFLPDELENLGQSAVATVFFCNNFLLHFTSREYWAVANDFKPLMHTWSLAI